MKKITCHKIAIQPLGSLYISAIEYCLQLSCCFSEGCSALACQFSHKIIRPRNRQISYKLLIVTFYYFNYIWDLWGICFVNILSLKLARYVDPTLYISNLKMTKWLYFWRVTTTGPLLFSPRFKSIHQLHFYHYLIKGPLYTLLYEDLYCIIISID